MESWSSLTDNPWNSYRADIKTVVIGDGITNIGGRAFFGHTSLTSVTIGDSVESIDDWAFAYCTSLASVTIPSGVIFIDDLAFACCMELVSITVPDSVAFIGKLSFDSCSLLQSIDVDDNNGSYCDIDGVLFNKDMTEIICYPCGKTASSYIIPTSVTTIADFAFSDCSALESIVIPDGVKSVSNNAFSDCPSLASVTFLGDAPLIVLAAFSNTSPSLVFNYYSGTTGWTSPTWSDTYGVTYNSVCLGGKPSAVKNGFYVEDGGIRYYIDNTAQSGWLELDGNRMYFYISSGLMVTENRTIGGVWYNFESFERDGLTLYRAADKKNGFVTESVGVRYYVEDVYLTGWQVIDSEITQKTTAVWSRAIID